MLAAESIGIAQDDAFAFAATGVGFAMAEMSADVTLKRTRGRA